LASLAQLKALGLDRGIFPVLDAALADAPEGSERARFIELALQDTDRRVQQGRAVAPSFLLACLLWHEVSQRWAVLRADSEQPIAALSQAIEAVFEARVGDLSGRGKLATDMREIWMMQPRFDRRGGRQPFSLVEQPRYRAGYDFLRLRADAGEASSDLADWWEDFALGSDADREALQDTVRQVPRASRKAARPAAPAPAAPVAEGDVSEAEAQRKRRRRRRKPAGAEGNAPAGDAP
jgi:poly(A) polymerase